MELKICPELKSLPLIKAGEINDLQGSLKDLSEVNFNKLLKRIETKGFKYPLYLYFNKQKKAWNLDGNQRLRVIKKVWGDEVELPFVEVYAPNIKAAKLELLAISSEYGTVTKDGFDEFSGEFEEIDFEEVFDETTFDVWSEDENHILIKEELKPFLQNHILISYPINYQNEIMKILELLKNIPQIEIEKSAN